MSNAEKELGQDNPQVEQQFQVEIVDIVNATKIIEAAIDRGTFKAKELVDVTAVYHRLSVFVDEVTKSQAQGE